VQVEVDLLRRPVRPLRRNVVGCELDAHPGFPVDVDGVPVVVYLDRASQKPSPGAHGNQVGCVEDDDRPQIFSPSTSSLRAQLR